MPICSPLSNSMMVAIEAKRNECEQKRLVVESLPGGIAQDILNIGRVLAIFHPDALLQPQILVELIGDAGNIALQGKRGKRGIALRIERAILIFIDTQPQGLSMRKKDLFIDLRHQHEAFDRWAQRSHKQPVIAARCRAQNRAGGVSSQPVCDQPFAIKTCRYVVANISPQREVPCISWHPASRSLLMVVTL